MKAFDLAVFASSGRYLVFEEEPPIAVDFHIRRISEIIGLVRREISDDEIRHLWFRVSTEASKKSGKPISPLRIDSLIWQTGVSTYDPRVKKHVRSRLEKLESDLAEIGIAGTVIQQSKRFLHYNVPSVTRDSARIAERVSVLGKGPREERKWAWNLWHKHVRSGTSMIPRSCGRKVE